MRRLLILASVATCSCLVISCSSGGGGRSASKRSPTPSSIAVTRGETLALHAMAYLVSNRPTVLFTVQIFGSRIGSAPTEVTVGRSSTMSLIFEPLAYPVWISTQPRRFDVAAHDGGGRMPVSTDGCASVCNTAPLYTPTGGPIAHAPSPGTETDRGFVLHLTTDHVEPGRYDFDVTIRDPSDQLKPTQLDLTDVVHVRVDIADTPPPSQACTSADLQQPRHRPTQTHTLTDTYVLSAGRDRLDPPPPGAQPRISSARALQLLSVNTAPDGGGTATVVLAMYSAAFPRRPRHDLPSVPETYDVLAWVLYSHRVANPPGSEPMSPPVPGVTQRRGPQAACGFLDGLDAIDATTGQSIASEGWSPVESDPDQFLNRSSNRACRAGGRGVSVPWCAPVPAPVPAPVHALVNTTFPCILGHDVEDPRCQISLTLMALLIPAS